MLNSQISLYVLLKKSLGELKRKICYFIVPPLKQLISPNNRNINKKRD